MGFNPCNRKSLCNFTNQDVPRDVLDQIEYGQKNVPIIKMDGSWAVKTALREILDNLKTFRRIIHRRPYINQTDVRNWLRDAIIDEGDCVEANEYIEYYKHVRDNLSKAMKIIKWNCDQSNGDLEADVIKKAVEIPGSIFNLAYKN
jgi:hypothetical protein